MIEDYIEYQSDIKKMLDASYKNNRLSHAYIFSGDKGVGKEAMALYFTALLNTKGNVCYDSDIVKSIFNHEFINLYEIAPKKNEIVKDDVQALLKELLKLDNPYTCPHGRPTIIRMTKEELDKKFKRIVEG